MAERIAVEAGSSAAPAWVAADVAGDDAAWRLEEGPVDDGLYSGRAGIALALAAAATSGAAAQTAEVASAAALEALSGGYADLDSGQVDLAAGSAGIAYAAAWVGQLLDRPDIEAEARALAIKTATSLPVEGGRLDLLTGAGGAALGCLAVAAGEPAVRDALVAVGEQIARAARPEPWGVSWVEPAPGATSNRVGLLGLAHGTSGIALVLAAAAASGGGPTLAVLGQAALDYERAWFEPALPGWPDLRSLGGGAEPMEDPPGRAPSPGCPTAWCHGAVGIGLARLALVAGIDAGQGDPGARTLLVAEAAAAVEAARQRLMAARARLREGVTEDCCLCHGLAGPVELLLSAARLAGGQDHLRAAQRSADLLLAQYAVADAWPCGLPRPADWPQQPLPEPPGLFLGRAGILLTLLRSDQPERLPAYALPQPLPATRR
jgi:lantibiotic modifying enzyme